jgi:hypothetical protein
MISIQESIVILFVLLLFFDINDILKMLKFFFKLKKKIKYEVYEDAGVKEYWIVDPIRETVQVHVWKDGTYIPQRTLVPDDMLNSTVLTGFSFSLSKIFPAAGREGE